jgi:hypothetical protein
MKVFSQVSPKYAIKKGNGEHLKKGRVMVAPLKKTSPRSIAPKGNLKIRSPSTYCLLGEGILQK